MPVIPLGVSPSSACPFLAWHTGGTHFKGLPSWTLYHGAVRGPVAGPVNVPSTSPPMPGPSTSPTSLIAIGDLVSLGMPELGLEVALADFGVAESWRTVSGHIGGDSAFRQVVIVRHAQKNPRPSR